MDQLNPTASKIMIIRHAEKPENLALPPHGVDINGIRNDEALLVRGWQRAGALVDFFAPAGGRFQDPNITTPQFVFASKAVAGSPSDSLRPQETVMPLIEKLAITPNFDFCKGDEPSVAEAAMACQGIVLICWEHKNITDIAQSIHINSKDKENLPGNWPGDRFDIVWIFDLDEKTGLYGFQEVDQKLLARDKHEDTDCGLNFASGTITLTLDAPLTSADEKPKNFRSMSKLNMAGSLASGSAQYSPAELDIILEQAGPHPLTVVDLRQEAHGFLSLRSPVNYEDQIAVSWFAERDWINVAKGPASLDFDERSRLSAAAKSQRLAVYEITAKIPFEDGICTADPWPVLPDGTYNTEQALLAAREVGYMRFPTSDHCRPRDSEVDRFIAFEASLAQDAWLHFHCRAGDGRTTTFMVLHDIFHNAPKDALEDILARQGPKGIGGIDLKQISAANRFDSPFLLERLAFINDFYQYVCDARQQGGFQLTWSSWVSQKAKNL